MFDPQTMARFRTLKHGIELVLSKRYRQPMEKVFTALTIPERIIDWMDVVWEGDPAPLKAGSNFSYRFGNSDLCSVGRVTVLDPPRVIEHTWFENLPPIATVRWSLEPDGDGCILTLTQTTPRRDDAARNGAGWTMIMGRLDAWLAGTAFQPMESWREVHDRLASELGPEAIRDGDRFVLEDGRTVVRFKRVLHAPPPQVWPWLVEPAKLKDWLGDVDVELHPGGAYRIRFAMAPVVMEGTLTEVDAARHRLAMIWREPWFKADEVRLEFELEPYGTGGTLFTLTHTFPAGYDPQDYLAGWHEFLDALEDAMGGKPFVWDTPERKREYETREKTYKAITGAGG
jgi:uncharacterized protein YndB with AHSA1/START domain